MKLFLKQHGIGIIISLVIGAIIAAPPIVFQFSDAYAGFPLMKTNTEAHYAAQIHEVYDGHPALGNPFFADLKEEPYLFPPLGPHLYAFLGRLFRLEPITAVLVFRFFFTATMAWFVYLFAGAISRNRLVGYVAAPFVMLGYSLVDPGHIVTMLREGGIPAHTGFLDYGRPVNPQVSSMIFFAYLYFFWRTIHESGKRWKLFGVFSAVLLGTSFYAYLFTWTFLLSLNGFLFLLYAWKKDWTTVRRIVAVSVGGGFLGVPYLLHTLQVSQHPWYAESAPRFGFVRMREWQVSRLLLGLLIPFIFIFRRLEQPARTFFLAFFATGFFVANEQVLTGLYLFNHHYHWYYTTPLAIIFITVLISTLWPLVVRRARFERVATTAGVFLLIVYGIAVQCAAYARVLPVVMDEQRYAPVIAWLNAETPKDATVVASIAFSDVVPALTHNNVYFPNTGFYTLVPNERLLHTYLVYTFLRGIPNDNARAYFEGQRTEISGFAFGYAYSFLPGVCYGCFPASVIDALEANYAGLHDGTFIDFLKKYPADYVVWDTAHDPEWQVDRFGLREAARFGDMIVYAL